ncbi:MAG: hypothetical protein KatS3mg089_0098 [Patescibacteria group bacterium]|nr:MAG: hypothetical protein KatS3mg089_0098 [Patescibacteria group bacterium]
MQNNSLRTRSKFLFFIMMLSAFFLRFNNLNWDQGHFFHPDERNIANAVSHIKLFSQLDPQFYAYGGFLIYLYKITADIFSFIFSNPLLSSDWAFINLLGRHFSAFFSTLTLIPLYLVTRIVFQEKVALITSILYTFTVSSIQTAHFSITENFLTLSIVTLILLALNFYKKHKISLVLWMGILLGISAATKTTGISFAIVPLITLGILLKEKKLSIKKAFLFLIMILSIAVFIFTLSSPYTFLKWNKFRESMEFENSVVLGTNRVVYTLQFSDTKPYLFQLKNLFWQIGPVFVMSILGIIYLVYQFFKKPNILFCILFIFPLLYFAYVGAWYAKFIRYMVPIIPFLLIAASVSLAWIQQKFKILGIIIFVFFLTINIIWAVAFSSIYVREQTRISASKWIYEHISPGSKILTEHWDDGLPIPLGNKLPDQYQIRQLTIYEPDNASKIEYYARELSQADYIFITTRRLYGTLLHLPKKYPITQRYYQLLFSGELGYQKIAEFSSYPQILGIVINDDLTEETFQVYDHPKVLIFKNVNYYPEKIIKEKLRTTYFIFLNDNKNSKNV